MIAALYHAAVELRAELAYQFGIDMRNRTMFLRSITLAAIILMLPGLALAQYYSPYGTGTGSNPASHPVQGYTTNQGTYVPPHYATNPNATQRDNYTAKGNVNPYTGAVGTRPPGY